MEGFQSRDKSVDSTYGGKAVLQKRFVIITVSLSVSALLAAPELAFPPEGIVLGEFAAGEPVTGRWITQDKEGYSLNLYLFIDNSAELFIDYMGLWRTLNDDEKKDGHILCNSRCEMVVYIPDDFNDRFCPKDCVREHEMQHINDLHNDTGCKKDSNGCCKEEGLSPDERDYGGKDKLNESECKAYLVTAKCCTRKSGLLDGTTAQHSNEEITRYYRCVQVAMYAATKPFNYVYSHFDSVCDNEKEFVGLLRLFEQYFSRNVKSEGGRR